ncbi:MAG: hypothetical protein K0R38_5185 [Polyangiaceae bacterium]|jgi:hypothetical protein|nr:hypothetical protein [Polyangiaceae bacterium]
MADENQVTVSDLTQLIQTREETRAELRLLAIRAYEHWLEVESRIEALESRLDGHSSGSWAIGTERGSLTETRAPVASRMK